MQWENYNLRLDLVDCRKLFLEMSYYYDQQQSSSDRFDEPCHNNNIISYNI